MYALNREYALNNEVLLSTRIYNTRICRFPKDLETSPQTQEKQETNWQKKTGSPTYGDN